MPPVDSQSAATPARGRRTHQGEAERLPPLRRGFCDYCEIRLSKTARAYRARFCSPACRNAYRSIAKTRGEQVYHLLMIWRRWRGRKNTPGEGMLSRISRKMDEWHRADTEARAEQRDRVARQDGQGGA